jgi:arginyl-tRNA synthetase
MTHQGPLRVALERVFDQALRKAVPGLVDVRFEVSKPRDKAFGDYATNVAMVLARDLGRNPMEVARSIVAAIETPSALIDSLDIKKPGFINVELTRGAYEQKLCEIVSQTVDDDYGRSGIGERKKVQVEFVSANPTGPLNVVSARAAAVGDALVRLLDRVGYDAKSEFYVNDSGTQVELLGESLKARFLEVLGEPWQIPEGGYPGDYLKPIAEKVAGLARATGSVAEVEAAARFLPACTDEQQAVDGFLKDCFGTDAGEQAAQESVFRDYLDFRAALASDHLTIWPALYICHLSSKGLGSLEMKERMMWIERFRSCLRGGAAPRIKIPDTRPPESLIPVERVFLGEAVEGFSLDFARFAVQEIVEEQQASLAKFGDRPEGGLHFDCWVRESSLGGDIASVSEALTADGRFVVEKEGAVWLRGGEDPEQEEWVIRRSTGQPTYFLSDIAYHVGKRRRGFEQVIDIWGPDHHGHIDRMHTAMRVASEVLPDVEIGRDWLTILIAQQVNLIKDGRRVQMSKRSGEYVTLDDVVSDVGADVARFFFLMRRCNSHLDFDLDLAKRQSEENPVYYVQYAHARISSIVDFARQAGYEEMPPSDADLSLLDSDEEIEVIKALADFDDLVIASALALEPHRLTGYLIDLAARFHRFYHNHRVVTDDRPATLARLHLCLAVRVVIRSALALLGISAPEKM